jgi:tRNA (guanine-N7-)-methyltransferase
MKSKYYSLKPFISPYTLDKPVDWGRPFNRSAPLDVEIGFGMGEMLRRMAEQSPERNFIGIEQHWERVCKTLRTMVGREDLYARVRILKVDARVAFERLIAPESVDNIYCFFPCPWPKKSHIKYRLFSNGSLRLFNNRLKGAGTIKIVTDFHPYIEWVLAQAQETGFQGEVKTVRPRYDTKFERKWRDEGQEEFFELSFRKEKHIEVPVEEDIHLKSYTLKDFCADRLQLDDEKGDISVIFKGKLFDRDQQKVMVQCLVAEGHLAQYFWVSIVKKKDQWMVVRAESQNFFSTAGIARALELVYEAAERTNGHYEGK